MIRKLLVLRRQLSIRRFSPPELEELQNRRLRATIQWVFETVPYYRELFNSAGIVPADIRTTSDLKYIPVSSKHQLVSAGASATASRGLDLESCVRMRTSGSTGKPLRLYLTAKEEELHRLIQFRTLLGMGLRPNDHLAVVSAVRAHRAGLHQRLGLYRSYNIPRFISPGEQLLALQRGQPTVLWVYATVLRQLLELVDYQLGRIVQPRAIITVGEVFDRLLRDRLLSNLDTEFYRLYGSTEAGIIAGDCPEHKGLHVNADQIVLECVGDDGPFGAGARGAAVITTLNMRAMPLIRYSTGDIISFVDERCSCGSPLPLINGPFGRRDDLLLLPSGKRLTPLECDAFSQLAEVQQYRFVQERQGQIILQVKLRELQTRETLPKIRRHVESYIGESIGLDIQVVDHFPDKKLKFRTFISKLARQ